MIQRVGCLRRLSGDSEHCCVNKVVSLVLTNSVDLPGPERMPLRHHFHPRAFANGVRVDKDRNVNRIVEARNRIVQPAGIRWFALATVGVPEVGRPLEVLPA
jgi:hypothetical protein